MARPFWSVAGFAGLHSTLEQHMTTLRTHLALVTAAGAQHITHFSSKMPAVGTLACRSKYRRIRRHLSRKAQQQVLAKSFKHRPANMLSSSMHEMRPRYHSRRNLLRQHLRAKLFRLESWIQHDAADVAVIDLAAEALLSSFLAPQDPVIPATKNFIQNLLVGLPGHDVFCPHSLMIL